MTQYLKWRQVPRERENNEFHAIKKSVARQVWNEPDAYSKEPTVVGKELIPFLEGIVAGNGSGDMAREAQELIAIINRYGNIQLYIS